MDTSFQDWVSFVEKRLLKAHNDLLPRAALHLNISEAAAEQQIELNFSATAKISAEAQTDKNTITISLGLIAFLKYMTALLLANIGDQYQIKKEDNRLKSISQSFMHAFWMGRGSFTPVMDRLGNEIMRDFLNPDSRLMGAVIIDYLVHFVIAHELGHIISRRNRDSSRNVPCLEVADYFISGLGERGLVAQFAQYTNSSAGIMKKMWAEELNADATALDLCYALDLQGKILWESLLSSDEEAALPEQHKSNILNAYGTQIAADFFFDIMHLLDVFFARAFNLWVPFKTHPPSVVRMVFSRCIFRPPEIKIQRNHTADEPQVMVNLSNVLLGGLSKLPDGIHPIALSRLTDQIRNEILFQNLCYYVRYAYSDNHKRAPKLRLRDIVIIEDPVFQSDRLLNFTNLMCSLVEDLTKDIPGSSLDNEPATQSADEKHIEELLKRGISLVGHSHMNDALRIFQEILAKDANNRDALFYSGIAFGYIGQYEQSLSHLERTEAVTEVVTRRTLAELTTYKAAALAKLGRHMEAMALFDKAIRYDEKHTWAWYSKGIALSENGELERAVECFSKALELKPSFPDGWRDKGLALATLGLSKQALACYDKALSINPMFVAAWNSKGNVLFRMDRLREALESYEKVVELDPSHENALHNRDVLRSMVEGSSSTEKAAIRDRLDEVSGCEGREQEKWSWVEKGMALDGIDEWKRAIDCYDKALQIDHEFAAAWSHKGNSLLQMRSYADALECFERALDIDGKYARAWVGKGDVLSNSFLDEKGGVVLNFSDRKDILSKIDTLRGAIRAYNNFIECATPDLGGYHKAIKNRCSQIESTIEFLLKSLECT